MENFSGPDLCLNSWIAKTCWFSINFIFVYMKVNPDQILKHSCNQYLRFLQEYIFWPIEDPPEGTWSIIRIFPFLFSYLTLSFWATLWQIRFQIDFWALRCCFEAWMRIGSGLCTRFYITWLGHCCYKFFSFCIHCTQHLNWN